MRPIHLDVRLCRRAAHRSSTRRADRAHRDRSRLLDADGRVVARDVRGDGDVPPFDRAAMDGYAVIAGRHDGRERRRAAHARGVSIACSRARCPCAALAAGECIEIATGAPMPAGADAVVMVEETTRDGTRVRIRAGVTARQNVGRRGADIAAGDTVVSAGQVLTPSRIGALAATGVTRVEVFARPTVAILSTGNEIVAAGRAARARTDLRHQSIHARSRRRSATAAARWRCRPSATRSTSSCERIDRRAQARSRRVLRRQLGRRSRSDSRCARARAASVIFHGIAVKPGKPTVFARHRPARRSSACPAIRRRACRTRTCCSCRSCGRWRGCRPWEPRTIDAAARPPRSSRRAGRHQFYTVRVVERPRRAGVQGVGRHHEHGERRRVHRDSARTRHRRSGDGRHREVLFDLERDEPAEPDEPSAQSLIDRVPVDRRSTTPRGSRAGGSGT